MNLVVTAVDTDGVSVFESEAQVTPLVASMAPELVNYPVLATLDPSDLLETTYSRSDGMTFFPPPGALRAFQLVIDAPRSAPGREPTAEQFEEGERLFPGLFSVMEADPPGMHRTDTVDFVTVLEGEVVLELDKGQERRLQPHDVVIQRGARHRWRNETDRPVRLSVVMLGLQRGVTTKDG
ncbi:cupin domain-containing protein [Nocardioides immobilis]|uniref:Cupin domain-containing protein n=1 Tax=Nocardioides immobilis TaxID=2049295 RepID=A0A417Y9B3_9ACTN|nr:cupin domain-containing protein [Nocardioides immobilis]RHW29171.1 cupin domain-containing protein [Nocardioides immobilis]